MMFGVMMRLNSCVLMNGHYSRYPTINDGNFASGTQGLCGLLLEHASIVVLQMTQTHIDSKCVCFCHLLEALWHFQKRTFMVTNLWGTYF